MTTTPRLLLTDALLNLQAISEGASPSTAQETQGLRVLNRMLDWMNAQKHFIYQVKLEEFAWAGVTASRTISGTTPDFDTTWPNRIEYAAHVDSAGHARPLSVTEDRGVYERILDKSLAAEPPEILFFNRAFPQGTLYIWPVPPSAWTLRLSSWKLLSAVALITDSIDLPPGYEAFLAWNLAKWLWPSFPNPASLGIVNEMAQGTGAILKRYNIPPVPFLSVHEIANLTRTSGYDINPDAYRAG